MDQNDQALHKWTRKWIQVICKDDIKLVDKYYQAFTFVTDILENYNITILPCWLYDLMFINRLCKFSSFRTLKPKGSDPQITVQCY